MMRVPTDMSRFLPMTRETATRIAAVAGRYDCTLILEKDGIVLNLKSMIGLLSQSIPRDGQMTLTADGIDEAEAITEIQSLLAGLRPAPITGGHRPPDTELR